MIIHYGKLWDLLHSKNMNRSDLLSLCGISSRTLSKLSKNQNVNTDTLLRICKELNCDLFDIMELRDGEAESLFEAFRAGKELIATDEFCKTYRFFHCGREIILRKTIQKANKHTVIQCHDSCVSWEQKYPLGLYPASETKIITQIPFAGKQSLSIFVISGSPMCIQNLDEGICVSAGGTPTEKQFVYVMSEAAFKKFSPSRLP